MERDAHREMICEVVAAFLGGQTRGRHDAHVVVALSARPSLADLWHIACGYPFGGVRRANVSLNAVSTPFILTSLGSMLTARL
jgi:hypothetical protein